MKDKIVLITGATGGIGKQTAISLAKLGATVIITGRNNQSGEEAVNEIKTLSKNENIDLIIADISTISGMKILVTDFKSKYDGLDVLINNAGSAMPEFIKNDDGIEMNFAVNVIAPYVLTTLLMDSLKLKNKARVITLTGGDLPAKIDLDNLQSEKLFSGLSNYSQTKMAMMCLMYEYSQRNKNSNTTVNICYPGQASTKMTQSVTKEMLPFFLRPLFPLFKLLVKPDNGESARKASRASVYLATSKDVENKSGIYCDKNMRIKEIPKAVADKNIRNYIWKYVTKLVENKL